MQILPFFHLKIDYQTLKEYINNCFLIEFDLYPYEIS